MNPLHIGDILGDQSGHRIIDTIDFSELSESEIELSEDEGAEFLSGDNRGNSLDQESEEELTRVEELIDDPESEVEIDDDEVLDETDIINNCPDIVDVPDVSEEESLDDGDTDSNLVVEITPLSEEEVSSGAIVSVVVADILNDVHRVSSLEKKSSQTSRTDKCRDMVWYAK